MPLPEVQVAPRVSFLSHNDTKFTNLMLNGSVGLPKRAHEAIVEREGPKSTFDGRSIMISIRAVEPITSHILHIHLCT